MKTSFLFALSVSLVACGGSLDGEDLPAVHDEAALREGFLTQPAFEKSSRPVRRNVVIRAVAAIEAARLANEGVVALDAERVEAARGTDVLVLSVSVLESAREALLISASRPVSADTMLGLSGVAKLNLSCKSRATGQTTSSAHCTWADGRELSATELRALPELLSFVGSLED